MILFTIFILTMLGGLISFAVRLSWGITKFMLGFVAAVFCPGLVLLVLIGSLAPGWLWLLLAGVLCIRALRRPVRI